MERTYYGFKNYETGATSLWLDNEEGSQRECYEMARQCREQAPDNPNVPRIWTVAEAARYEMAHWLKEMIEEMLLDPSSERQGRVIDHDETASMEKKKREGYF